MGQQTAQAKKVYFWLGLVTYKMLFFGFSVFLQQQQQ